MISMNQSSRSQPTVSKIAVCMLLVFGIGGCKKELERAMVSGAVTVDHKPITYGEIRFVPIGATKGPSWTAYIKEGKYSTEGSKGTPVGELKIEINAYRPFGGTQTSVQPDNNGGGVALEQYLPPKFNIESELKMTIPPGAGKVEQDFDLKTK